MAIQLRTEKLSAAFIVNLESNVSSNTGDTKNVLLTILINKIDNGTFPGRNDGLPVGVGLNATQIWIQTLAHASLATSLLADFGTVLVKQPMAETFQNDRLRLGHRYRGITMIPRSCL